MRKDVHIGLAIGGVLLAVLIVWGVVVSGSKKQVRQVTLDTTTDKASPSSAANDIPPPLTAAPTSDAPSTPPTVTPAPSPADPTPAPAAPGKKDWSALMSGKTTLDAEPLKTETPAPSDPTKSPADSTGQGGSTQIPASLVASAVTPASESDPTPQPSSAGPSTSAPDPGAAPAEPTPPVDPTPDPAAGSSKPAAQRTHTIQRGETFSSISKAVYGDARYYQQIAQANPKINPNKLRPGTVISLPDISAAKSAGKSPVSPVSRSQSSSKPQASAAPAVDLQKEYRVAASDSLYKISMRLYGSGEEVDHLYEMNKSIIGPDPSKLKVGTILKIPAPPTVATASSAS